MVKVAPDQRLTQVNLQIIILTKKQLHQGKGGVSSRKALTVRVVPLLQKKGRHVRITSSIAASRIPAVVKHRQVRQEQ
jgi:hypothetical protein